MPPLELGSLYAGVPCSCSIVRFLYELVSDFPLPLPSGGAPSSVASTLRAERRAIQDKEMVDILAGQSLHEVVSYRMQVRIQQDKDIQQDRVMKVYVYILGRYIR